MVFPGHFEDHILPDKIHILNVSFLVDSLDRLRGGVAGNIGYSLALLRQPCRIVATVGRDFEEYRAVLDEMGVDTRHIVIIEHELTASAFITTDRADNQITGFYPGAMARAGDYPITDHAAGAAMGVVSPTAPAAMCRHAGELAAAGVPYMYDPGQQIIALAPSALREGIAGAEILVGNDYEFAMMTEKTGMSRDELVLACPTVVVTYGELGSQIYRDGERFDIPAARPTAIVDPTGAGDGYRAGLLAATLAGCGWDAAGRIASLAATYAVEVKGTQGHHYTLDAFSDRFDRLFPEFSGAVGQLGARAQATAPQGE
ncbi:MAG TPA: carbohydrate kinase family protein [Thermomicrobiales bacterium]|nr:carbohydrate kinase family protein [Thermomicrobiales bacterium]